jgi:hypothetical protein
LSMLSVAKRPAEAKPSANGKLSDPEEDGRRCLEAALSYSQRGWSVLALCHPSHKGMGDWHHCESPGKRPWPKWKEHQERPATDTEIRGWWKQIPASNVGIALGPVSGLVRVDVDGPEAERELQRLSSGELPESLKFTGGRPESYGLLYAIPSGVTLKTTPKPGGIALADGELRLQAKGSQTVLPPSRHPSGRRYRWVEGHAPDDMEATPMPEWLVNLMQEDAPAEAGASVPDNGEAIRDGQRNDTLFRLGCSIRNKGLNTNAITAALLAENKARCVPPLAESEVRSLAESAAKYPTGRAPIRPPKPLLPHKSFPLDALPEPIRQYVADAADAIGCDPAFIAVPMLPVLAAAIGNTRRVELKKSWTEPAVTWAAVVAESGTHKSPGLDVALAHVRQKQDDAIKEWKEALADYEKQVPEERGERPVCERFLVSDTTVEALAPVLQHMARGVLLGRDELGGWLNAMDAYKPKGKGGDVAHFLEMHRAGQLLVDRKSGRENVIYVPRAAVSIAGSIQPETLRRALGREHFEDGLAARFLLTMPPRQPRRWSEREIGADVQKAVARVFSRLYGLGFDPAHNDCRPTVLPLSKKAKDTWVAFYDAHAHEQADLEGDLAAAWSKLEAYCARLALVIELVKWAALPPPKGNTLAAQLAHGLGPDAVRSASVGAAVKLVGWFGHEARRVYAALGDSDEERELRQLAGWIQGRGGSASARELQQFGPARYRGSSEDAEAAVEQLVACGAGEWVPVNPGDKGGRPTRRFRLFGATKPS